MQERYSRQVLFSGIGEMGQKKNKSMCSNRCGCARVRMQHLLGWGGKLTIADRDYVEWSNLQRQSYIQKKMRNSVNQKQLRQNM